uniref:LexA repressor n=1 Tax=candidate division WOR-3 bacterium TaxID=2052148 RepID=A0A7V4E4Z3_UNCW3
MVLTRKQKAVLDFIQQFILTHGYPPTIREIAEGLNLGLNSIYSIQRHLKVLEDKGFIRRNSRKPRGIELLHFKLSNAAMIPLVGKVSAGFPIPAIEEVEGNVVFDALLIKDTSNTIALRVKGDSMVGAGIYDRDIVVVRLGAVVKNGDIVVAFVDNEVTCKRFREDSEFVYLIPENPAYREIKLRKEEARLYILGKVVALFRRLE